MNIFSKGIVVAVLSASIAVPELSFGQDEYFRELESPRQIAPVVQLNPQEEDRYNLMLGQMRFNMAAGVGIEYNDNINLSDNNRQDDFIFRPSLNLEAVWPITDLNTLRFSLGVSYAKYFEHSEYDTRGVLLSPNSEIALTFYVGDVAITVRDRFSYQEDPYDIPILANVAVYRRFTNLASVQADWDLNPATHLTVGYQHYNLWSRDEEFESLDRAIDTIYVRPSVKLSPALTVGVNGSVSFIQHENTLNDGTGFLVGPFAEIALTESTRLYAEVGYQGIAFDDNNIINDSDDVSTYYVKSEIYNRLTENFSHRLSFSKTAELGFNSNYYDLYHLEYAADWRLTPSLILDPVAFYEHYETSGENGEEADRYGAALGMRYVLTPSLTLGADYRFIFKDSSIEDADYYQNVVLLSLFYNF